MFSISFCLNRACFTHLISSNLSCNLCLWYWLPKIKKLMQTYIVIVFGSILNVSTVHLNGIWHLIVMWRYLLKPVLAPCINTTAFPEGVHLIQVSLYIFKMVILYFWHFLAFCFQCLFFLAFSPLQNIVIILLRPVLRKNKKTKKNIIIKVVKKS